MLRAFDMTSQEYQSITPYPYTYMDNILNTDFAIELQSEIMNIPSSEFDRYDNPFEQKYTLRNKNNYTPKLQSLMDYLISDDFVNKLSDFVGYKLINDLDKNFYGVHKYKNGDKLDIHVDAGRHPKNGLKKQVTLGIYLSYKWDKSYGCELEIWRGDNSKDNDAKLHECVAKISPLFNRLVLFTCDDYAWHGNPEPVACPENVTRIFITISYMSENQNYENKRQKAFFIARPGDTPSPEKDKLRLLRADPEKYKEIYKYQMK